MDDEFPPLSSQPKDSQTVDSFGFLKSQVSNESAARAGTPTLPPGLPLPHAHPVSAILQEQRDSSKPSSPAPIVPPGFDSTPSHSRPISPELGTRTAATSRTQDISQDSLGSPIAKSARKPRITAKTDLPGSIEKVTSGKSASPSSGVKESPGVLSTSLSTHEASPLKAESTFSSVVGGPSASSAIGSRPNTPLTTTSRISDSPAPRHTRILRVVETPKPELPRPIGTAPSVTTSVIGTGKPGSRRQSLSSNSRPDTPGDLGSEADFYASASVSRAGSPPASSRIGSAPVRAVTKSQAKKERRQKAKEAEAKKAESAAATEEPVQAPIIGRKRKTKKAPSSAVEPADTASVSAADVAKPANVKPAKAVSESPKKVATPKVTENVKPRDEPVREVKPAPVEEPKEPKPAPAAWHSHNTVDQLMDDAEETDRAIKDLFVERTKPLHDLLGAMHKNGLLNLNKSPLFNPANISQRTDMKCNTNDYELFQHPGELTEEHRKALLRGDAARIGTEDIKSRFFITPRGCVLRHLDTEEEERYLELEDKRRGMADPFIVGDDSSNINGGLDALFAAPEKYNVMWVDDAAAQLGSLASTTVLESAEGIIPPNVLSAMEADSSRSHDWAIAQSAEFLQRTPDHVRALANATAKQMLGSSGVSGSPTLDDVSAMTDEELKGLSGKSQKDLETTRKEMDAFDKKFAGLLRRNKKHMAQALAVKETLEESSG